MLRLWINQKTRTFSWLFKAINSSVSPFGPFYRQKWDIFLPCHVLQLVKSLPFHTPEAWMKQYPFWAEPCSIGHYRKYPPPTLGQWLESDPSLGSALPLFPYCLSMLINPSKPKINIQIPHTGIQTFLEKTAWENLLKDRSIFPYYTRNKVIILLILVIFLLDYILIM